VLLPLQLNLEAIAGTTTQSIDGVVSVKVTTQQTISGAVRVPATTLRAIDGTVSVLATTDQEIIGVLRVVPPGVFVSAQTISGTIRVFAIRPFKSRTTVSIPGVS